MNNDVIKKESFVFDVIKAYLESNKNVKEIEITFGDAKKFESSPKRPKKVHSFFFKTEGLLNILA